MAVALATNRVSAGSLYSKLETDRWHYIERGREAAALTIPHLLPREGAGSSTELEAPFQGMGARGVNSLASSLLLALLPPNSPFFRLKVDPKVYNEIAELDSAKAEIDLALGNMEQTILSEIERRSLRTALYGAIRQLIVTGNTLIQYLPEGGMKVFRLDSYVVKRAPNGSPKCIIIKSRVPGEELPNEIRETAQPSPGEDDIFDLYTSVYFSEGKCAISQEVGGVEVPDSYQEMPEERCPYLALRFNRVDGEHYGRSHVEEYLGELQSLETLQQSIVYGSAAAAKVLFLVNPTGLTRVRTLSEAPNMAVREGLASDVSVMQVGKNSDFAAAYQTISGITDRLSNAFLLAEGSIRNAERVTAAEIRLIGDNLERQLGGTYSLLSQELQLPIVALVMDQMQRSGSLPALPGDSITAVITTGVQALGRSTDSIKLDGFMAAAIQQLGPDVLARYLNVGEWFTRKAAALGIDPKGLVKTEKEIQMEQQAAQQQQLAMQANSAAIDTASNVIQTQQPQPQVENV
jgi:hypothetical protein